MNLPGRVDPGNLKLPWHQQYISHTIKKIKIKNCNLNY